MRWLPAARAWLEAAREHPRHVVLFALAAGLALGPVSAIATVAAVVVGAATGGRHALSALAAGAVLLGAVAADARLTALDAGALPALHGRHWEGSATLLEPVREHGGHASARVRLAGLDEQAVIRLRVPGGGAPGDSGAEWPASGAAGGAGVAWPPVGAVVAVAGRIAPLGRYDAYQRRRGAHAALEVDRLRATGAWRGGLPGALDSVRRRAEAGLARGLSPPEAALLSGMVLGEDERLSDEVRTDFKRSSRAGARG